MKKIVKLTESELRNMITESVRKMLSTLKEDYNQFSDSDFASEGNPYGFSHEDEDTNLDGIYGTFNSITVTIKNDNKPNAKIVVASKKGDNEQIFDGDKAQQLLNKIKEDADDYGSIQHSIYRNLYKYIEHPTQNDLSTRRRV